MPGWRTVRVGLVVALCLAWPFAGALAQTAPPASTAEEQVRQAEAARLKAFLEHDVATMDRLMADELIHTTTTGKTRDKTQFMQDFISRPTAFTQFETDDMNVVVIGNVAVTRGRYHNVVPQRSYGTPVKYARYLRVWANRDGTWKLVAHQATDAEQSPR
jgi:ketosteroid isomerase-like protein